MASVLRRAAQKAGSLAQKLERDAGVVIDALQPGPLGVAQRRLPPELLKQGADDATKALAFWQSNRSKWWAQRIKDVRGEQAKEGTAAS